VAYSRGQEFSVDLKFEAALKLRLLIGLFRVWIKNLFGQGPALRLASVGRERASVESM
jgi:hypothetical protein